MTLLGWDLEALLSKSGILLLIPVLQWDLDLGRIKYIILKVFPRHQGSTPRHLEWGQKLLAKILRGEGGSEEILTLCEIEHVASILCFRQFRKLKELYEQ